MTAVDLRDASVSPRRLAARIFAWIWALAAVGPMFGLIDLGTLFGLSDPRYLWAMSLEASWGSLLTFLLALGFAWVATVLGYAGLTYLAARAAGPGEGDETMGVDHRPVQVALGVALAVGSALLVLLPARVPLWR